VRQAGTEFDLPAASNNGDENIAVSTINIALKPKAPYPLKDFCPFLFLLSITIPQCRNIGKFLMRPQEVST